MGFIGKALFIVHSRPVQNRVEFENRNAASNWLFYQSVKHGFRSGCVVELRTAEVIDARSASDHRVSISEVK